MSYDTIVISLTIIFLIGMGVYMATKETYTIDQIENRHIITLDKDGVPNIVDIDDVNALHDTKFRNISSALKGNKIVFRLMEAAPNEAGGNPNYGHGGCVHENRRHGPSGRCSRRNEDGNTPCKDLVICPHGSIAWDMGGQFCTCMMAKYAWGQPEYDFKPIVYK